MQEQIQNNQQKPIEKTQKKSSNQLKALFYKNITLQSRQPFTNICQILTPIICIIFTTVIRNIVLAQVPTNDDSFIAQYPLVPFFFNNYFLQNLFPKLVRRNCLQWFQYQVKDLENLAFLGYNDGVHISKGMLHNIPTTSTFCSFNSSMQKPFNLQSVSSPFFRNSSTNHSLNEQLYQRNVYLANLNYSDIRKYSAVDKLPDGGIVFHHISKDKLQADIAINDLRYFQLHRGDGITQIALRVNQNATFITYYIIAQGMLSFIDLINMAYIKTLTSIKPSSGYMYMPVKQQFGGFVEILINTVATILFPLSLSLLLPVFLYNIVLQKQQKLIQMMRMNGMSIKMYWFVTFLFNFIIGLFTNIVFCIVGYFTMDSGFFHQTSWILISIVLLGWILAQIGLSVFFQVFLTSSRAASIIGYLISIWTNLIGATLSVALYLYPTQLPFIASLYPSFAFNRIFYLMFTQCSAYRCINSYQNISQQLKRCILVLYVSAIVFFILGMYLFEVVPQEFGVRQSIFFPITKLKQKISKKKEVSLIELNKQVEIDDNLPSIQNLRDQQANNQKNKLRKIDNTKDYPLICAGVKKVYQNKKVAVDGFDLVVQDREIFGLLGPNGAGKTTLISMITGIFSPTFGNAYVGGYSIISDIDLVHLSMGVCPQFDILWPQLTVEEHLYFYARLKGVQRKQQKKMVQNALKQVNLQQFKKFKAKQLSGGMKRRLSIGISLVGDPRIVFLDQPTTGLDPQNRRQIWQVLSNLRQKRSLFLTTHLMQQADTLCNRIGIITDGILRTVGTQHKLKRLYGNGYFLTINLQQIRQQLRQSFIQQLQSGQSQFSDIKSSSSILSYPDQNINKTIIANIAKIKLNKQKNKQRIQKIKRLILYLFPNCTINKQISGFLRFNLGDIMVSQVLTKIAETQQEQIRKGWSIGNSNLQDVFLKVVNKFGERQQQIQEDLSQQSLHEKRDQRRGSLQHQN